MTAQETNVVNAVTTTLGSTMAAGATSCSITSASGFPSVPFYIVIDPDDPAKREYMLIDSSIVGTTLSMTSTAKRNLSGSAGDVEHASGAVVRVSPPMRQLFDDIHDRIDGAVLEADTSTSGWGFVVDEDDMVSNSATKVPTQQSVKAYVDAEVTETTIVRKSADESVTSSTTLQDDNALTFAVAANKTYVFTCVLGVEGDAGADIKVTFTGPAGATGHFVTLGPAASLGAGTGVGDGHWSFQAFTTSVPLGLRNAGEAVGIVLRGVVATAGTAGNVTLQWAQDSSSGTATIVKAGSHIITHKAA